MKHLTWMSVVLFVHLILSPYTAIAVDLVSYYHNDTTGSPVAVTNSAGTKVWGADYEPFGELAGVVETVPNNQQFLAKTVDPETSLHLLGARHYDGKLGRFLSVDPVLFNGHPASARQLPQRFNLYAYSTNNPYRYADPNGQFLIPVIVAAVAATVFFPSTVNTPQDSADALHNAQTNLEFTGAILLSEIGGAVTAKGLGILGNAIGSKLFGRAGSETSSLLVEKSGEKLSQQVAKWRQSGGQGGREEFIQFAMGFANEARVAGNFVTGTVGSGPQALANATIFRKGSDFLVVQEGRIMSFVPNARPGEGIVNEFTKLGGSL